MCPSPCHCGSRSFRVRLVAQARRKGQQCVVARLPGHLDRPPALSSRIRSDPADGGDADRAAILDQFREAPPCARRMDEDDVVRYAIAVTIEAENMLPIYEQVEERLRIRPRV